MEIIRNKFICIAGTKNNTNQEPLKKLTANGEAMVGQYKECFHRRRHSPASKIRGRAILKATAATHFGPLHGKTLLKVSFYYYIVLYIGCKQICEITVSIRLGK